MPLYETDSKPAKKLEKILKRLKMCVKADEHNRKEAIEDLKFLNGDQWDSMEKRRRALSGRPALQVNLLPKFIDQVVGDGRHNRPRCKVRPASDGADINIANIREGIIADVEASSNAEAIYDQALEMTASCGYGAWRILTRYCEENPFQQEIYEEYIENPLQVYIDPSAKDPSGMDAGYGFILDKMTKDDFEDKYPDAEWPIDNLKTGQGVSDEHFYEDGLVTVAEYFEISEKEETLHLLENGKVCSKEDFKDLHKEWEEKQKNLLSDATISSMNTMEQSQPPLPATGAPGAPGAPGQPPQMMGQQSQALQPPMPGQEPQPPGQSMPPAPGTPPGQTSPQQQPKLPGLPPDPKADLRANILKGLAEPEPKIKKTHTIKVKCVKQYMLTAWEFLNENEEKDEDFPGKYIPIIQVRGKQRNIEGKRYVRSLIREAKDPQKLFNFWETAGAEIVALAPKAPWIGTAKMFEGYENDYAASNVENFPFLKYNIDPESPQTTPQRQGIQNPPVAIFAQSTRASDNIKAAIGMFNADIGQSDSKQTGAAVNNAQRPGDISTFIFQDNLARGVKLTGVIINEMIPEVYDTERDVRVRSFEGVETFVPVNTTLDKALERIKSDKLRYGGLNSQLMAKMAGSHNTRYVKFNELGSGRYDVVTTVGPSYATQRQESAQQLLQLVQAMPQQMALMADLIVKNLDFKDADEMARRLEKGLPPGMAKPRDGEPPIQPTPPPPAAQIAMAKVQVEQGKIQLQQMKTQQEGIKMEHEKIKLQIESLKLKLAIAEAGKGPEAPEDKTVEKVKLMGEHMEKDRRFGLDQDKLRLEHEKFQHQRQKDMEELKQSLRGLEMDYEKMGIDADLKSQDIIAKQHMASEKAADAKKAKSHAS